MISIKCKKSEPTKTKAKKIQFTPIHCTLPYRLLSALLHNQSLLSNLFKQEKGQRIMQNMQELEKQKLAEMEQYLTTGVEDSTLLVHLFSNTVEEELSVYSKAWNSLERLLDLIIEIKQLTVDEQKCS